MTEPDAGSDLQAIKTTAVPNGDAYMAQFVDGLAQGTVILIRANGERVEQLWKDGKEVK
jgi:hypothetical protein